MCKASVARFYNKLKNEMYGGADMQLHIEKETYDLEQEKEDILKSKRYKRASANRDAVGGQKGGK